MLRKVQQGIDEGSLNEAAQALASAAADGEPMDWSALDPIGISAVVKAFNHPVCSDF